ncbi:regulator of sigma E protease [Methylacidimicrobium cyclopophantes]|uniref:Regulator of sigma E protease n=1 Tax=Methylacidimicrobium cyclopophantes TaxID=1041766 RepID=A0A5E6MJI2_9BACT|nr:site-2 protease family protein [Methylacidimicrobium cyclopophantes]VVM05672.1 regulator of sigma E protease [Methylacidimicrobium cyclopophantes]
MLAFSEIARFAGTLFEVLFLFNVLIVVHEWGHFLAARWRGLRVERFQIWFGAALWEKEIGGVTYAVGWIPAGGFVALPQMAGAEMLEGKRESDSESLPPVKPWDKILVALAGPVANLVLAALFSLIVWVVGRPVSQSEATTTIGYVFPDSPAEKAGLQAGDRILLVDGHPVRRFQGMDNTAITWNIVRSEGSEIPITVERDGKVLSVLVTPVREERGLLQRKGLRQILILPEETPTIARVFPKSPAAQAGLLPGDQILSVDGHRLRSPIALNDYMLKHPGKPLSLEVSRAGHTWSVAIVPEVPVGETVPRIGLQWDLAGTMSIAHPNPVEQILVSVRAMTSTVAAMLSPRSDIKPQHLSGPVGIMRLYYLLFQSPYGWRLALWFSVLFNVNVALLNLLPIPVLDGGHILLSLAEWVRGRPLSLRVMEALQVIFATLIVGFILYVTFFDVQDLPWKGGKGPEMQFPAKTHSPPSPETR